MWKTRFGSGTRIKIIPSTVFPLFVLVWWNVTSGFTCITHLFGRDRPPLQFLRLQPRKRHFRVRDENEANCSHNDTFQVVHYDEITWRL